MLLADRFLRQRGDWFDIATADAVRLSIHAVGSRREQIAWAEHCAMLSVLRHPMLNPLLDYGAASNTMVFEAYAACPPVRATPAGLSSLVIHSSRFLRAHGVDVPARAAAFVFRGMDPIRQGRPAPIGWVLQPRFAIEAVTELLGTSVRGGITSVAIAGPAGAGVRTAALLLAMAARREGYVPICAAALARWPFLIDELAYRHVCLITTTGDRLSHRSAASALMTRLALHSARPHVCLTLATDGASASGLHLQPMGLTSMTSMLYVDPDYGPSADEVLDAARHSEGLPGRFVARLGATGFERTSPVLFAVHESAVTYGPLGQPAPSPSPRRSRIGSVIWRARSRAAGLENAGRHAAARRLLERAARVLEARGDACEAARCRRQLAWSARARGDTKTAVEWAERARATDQSAAGQAAASLIIAVCWTDDHRVAEAEAALRGLAAAAEIVDARETRDRIRLALARAVFWDGRFPEAAAAVDPLTGAADSEIACEALLLLARSRLQMSESPAAMQAAREALARAGNIGIPRLQAGSHRVMAEALAAAGDLDGTRAHVRSGLAVCSTARMPLMVARLRGVLLAALRDLAGPPAETQALRACLLRTLARPIPALLRRTLEAACGEAAGASARVRVPGRSAPAVEQLLHIAHQAADDRTAIAGVLQAICERTDAASAIVLAGEDARTIATSGRPWRERPAAAERAAVCGTSVAPARDGPTEAAEPVRYGGALIAAFGMRWLAGATPPPSTAEIMRAAAMALAPHVRAVMDEQPPSLPPPICGDLLGDSAAAEALRESIQRAARAPFPVLIEGESGSGKELVARAIHKLSPRHLRRFCAINCAALSDELIEAELFGHTRGAFTGATAERAGLFEEADDGTLFLDEVGELSARAQAKLLRVLQEGEVRRVGENLPRRVDVRIVAATNRRLAHEAAGGRFRIDLRFRLDVLRLVVPPLRERASDIPILARHFWQEAAARVGSNATLGPDAIAALSRHDWPGNVRELQNVIAWMAVHAPRRGRVHASLLPAHLASAPLGTGSFEAAREEFERRYLRAALAQAGGHRQAAARALGISRQGLAKMMRRLGIDATSWSSGT